MRTNEHKSENAFIVNAKKPWLAQAWPDGEANPYNSPISHLVHSELAKHNLRALNYPEQESPNELKNWMSLIAKLNDRFHTLEKLINHPYSSNSKKSVDHLIQELEVWHKKIQDQLKTYDTQSIRIQHLVKKLSTTIMNETDQLVKQIKSIREQPEISIEQIRYLHAPHDLSFFTPSIGRWLSEQMHHVLQTGLSGAYHLSPTRWYNLVQIHPAIQALSNAKKNVSLKSFALSGIAHTTPFHAHHPNFFIPDSEREHFIISKNNPIQAEKFISALEQKSLNDIHYSVSFVMFIPKVFAILLFELPLLLIRLGAHILNAISIIMLCGYIPKFIANAEAALAQFHESYSPYNALQKLENQWQIEHWERHVSKENLDILKQAQIHNNVFVELGHCTQATPLWKKLHAWYDAWKNSDHTISLSAPTIPHLSEYLELRQQQRPVFEARHTSHNQLETAVDIIEEIAMALDNQSIDAVFRTNPGPALLCFQLSMFGFTSLLTPMLIPSQLAPLKHTMHLILNDLCQKFMGHDVTENYLNVQLSSFLFWQLSFYGSKLVIDIADPSQRLWYQQIAQHPDSFIQSAIVILGLGVLEAHLPFLPESIPLTNIPNPLAIFYNGINQEALNCIKNGTAPYSLTSLAVISVKSFALYINLLIGQEFSAEIMTMVETFIFHPKFLTSLHAHFDSEQPLKHTEFIQQFCKNNDIPSFSDEILEKIGRQLERTVSLPHPAKTAKETLCQILQAFEQQDPFVENALNNHQFAIEMYHYLSQLFDDFHKENPDEKLDKDAFLLQFYSTYCEFRTINILRLLEIIFLPLHFLTWQMAVLLQSDLWATYGCKKFTEDLYLIFKLIYNLTHPLAQFTLICYNYVFLNTLRIIPFILKTSLETVFGIAALEKNRFYQSLHMIDDQIQSLKIHYTVNQLLWPVQILFANLSFFSGRFFDFSVICHTLIEKLLNEENPVEISVENMYN
jgi:archaellum component FlaC